MKVGRRKDSEQRLAGLSGPKALARFMAGATGGGCSRSRPGGRSHREQERSMKRAVVGGSLLALALMSNRLEAANAGEGSLTAAEAKRLAQCQTNQVTIVEVPAGCGVRFEVARFGAAESGFQMQYAKPPQWLADGAPGNVFWPAPDTVYHRYPQQTEGAFQPRPNGSLRVRVLG